MRRSISVQHAERGIVGLGC